MIEHVQGNLLEADADALVNTVNTAGVMGKGIALQFRQAFPDNYESYAQACERGEVEPGKMFVVRRLTPPLWIINFPTKRDWRHRARLADIESGLAALVECIRREGIQSIAIPPLGCGNGGLDWSQVRPRIERALAPLGAVRVLLFDPQGAPAAAAMKVATTRPAMTPGRAALLCLLDRYALPWYEVSLLEVQKLTYFMQAAGEPLRLEFNKNQYGPYAENLHHVLQRLEGHYIRGYGDRSRTASIHLMPGASDAAAAFLHARPESMDRLRRVSELIAGFETPLSMELLATVHWLVNADPAIASDMQAIVQGVQGWNEHKKLSFSSEHIHTAWQRLKDQAWI